MSELVATSDIAAGRVRRFAVSDEGGGRLEDTMAVGAFRGKRAVGGEDVLLEIDRGSEIVSINKKVKQKKEKKVISKRKRSKEEKEKKLCNLQYIPTVGNRAVVPQGIGVKELLWIIVIRERIPESYSKHVTWLCSTGVIFLERGFPVLRHWRGFCFGKE